jgi:hypothetical protein
VAKSGEIILRRQDPIGKYELNLSSDYGLAVVYDLLYIVANHPSLTFKTFDISEDFGKSWNTVQLEKYAQLREDLSDNEKREILFEEKKQKIGSDYEHILQVFNHFDHSKDGELNFEEFRLLLEELGMKLSDKEVHNIIFTTDIDGTGMLELNEIESYFHKLAAEAPLKIWSIRHRIKMMIAKNRSDMVMNRDNPSMSSGKASAKTAIINYPPTAPQDVLNSVSSSSGYYPPFSGHVRIEVVDTYIRPDHMLHISRIQVSEGIEI